MDMLMVCMYICTTGGSVFTHIQFVTVMESCICMHESLFVCVFVWVHTERNIARKRDLVRVARKKMKWCCGVSSV